MGNCGYFVLWKNTICNSNFQVRNIYFRSPNDSRENEELELCNQHFNDFFNDLNIPIKEIERLYGIMFRDNIKRSKLARRNDVIYDYDKQKLENDKVKEKIYSMKNETCMNSLCNADLKKVEEKLFSATVFTLRGKVGQKLYFCSRNCWIKLKARMGKEIILPYGPKAQTLDHFN